MRQEKAKKSKLWIVLVIAAAALLIAGGIAAFFLLGSGEPEGPKGGRAEIYWNVDGVKYTENSESGLSTREPGADGLYHITFAIDGAQVELTCADKKLVNRIDMNKAMGLVLDADGMIVDMMTAESLATVAGTNMYVRFLENGVLTVNSSVALNGMELELPITDITGIYNCDESANMVGEKVEAPTQMDQVMILQNDLEETTHIFIVDSVPETKIYWRMDRYYNSDTAKTTRVPDENGVYTIPFAVEGAHVELKCKDEAVATAIDAKGVHNCCYGFIFDEEGYIVSLIDPGLAIKGVAQATNMDIVELTDTSFVAMKRIPGTGQGSDYNGIITEDTIFYNVNTTSEVFGEETQPQLGDRLMVLSNTKKEAQIVFITTRMVDSPLYFNPSVKYDTDNKVTTRKPDAQGRYVYDLIYGGGKTITVWTKDINKANEADSNKYGAFALKLSEDNEILDVYHHSVVHGYNYTLNNAYVTNYTHPIIAGCSYTSGWTQSGIMSSNCKVYDYSDMATVKGEETTLREHDRIVAYRDYNGQLAEIHVILRTAPGTELYYNLGRKYSSTTKETTREPIDGWYVFTLAKDGKQVTAKTSDKALASKIDSYSPAAVALKVVNGIIYECWPGHRALIGGYSRTSNYVVREIDMERSEFGSYRSDYTTTTLNPNVYRNIWTTMAEDVKVYNVSENVKSHRGELTTLQIGDKIHAIRSKNNDVAVIFVTQRDVKTGPAASWDYKYNDTTGETSRVPDADGYYVYTIARDGKVGTYKTKDKALATKIDAFGDVFAFTNDGDIITNVLDIKYVQNVESDTGSKYDVHAYGNGKITIKKNRPTSSDAFKEYTFDVSSNVKVIDFTPGENFGQKGEVGIGDRIILLRDSKKVVTYICILQKHDREAGAYGLCPDCGEIVFWEPWSGGGFTTREGYHYYLAKDVQREAGLKFSNTDKDFKVVLDLNGHTITTNNRIAAIQNNETFVILDTSKAQTGKIQGVGSTTEGGANGGGLFIYGGNFKMYGGTVQLCEVNHHNNKQGGTVYVGQKSTAELMGGKIIGSDANTSGGAVHIVNSSVKIGGDVQILGGVAPKGNSVYVLGNSTVDISGNAVITGGMQVDAADKLTISGKPQITAGTTSDYSLKLATDALLTLGKLEKGAKIGITAYETFTNPVADEATAKAYAGYFYSDSAKKSIVAEGKTLVVYQVPVAAPDAVCEHCGETVEWTLWKGEAFTEGGHYYLATDVMMSTGLAIGETEGENFHVVLDLNGCTISSDKHVFMVRRGEKLTILDSSEDKTGTVIGTGRGTGSNAGVLQAYYKSGEGTAELEILGGTIEMKEGSQAKAGGVIHANAGTTVTIENATLIGGEVAAEGGTIYAYDADVTVGEGTVVKAGTAANKGDSIYAGSGTTLTIVDATIEGGVQADAGVNVTLEGEVVIEKAAGGSAYSLIVDGVKLNAAGLTAGSSIGITKTDDGVFTTNFADEAAATAAKAYFKADNGTTEINLAGNALCYGAAPAATVAHCEYCGQDVTWIAWDGMTVSGDAHLIIPAEGTVVPSRVGFNNGHVVIDLQGNALTSDAQMFRVGANADVYIMDSVGGGTVTSKGESAHGGIAMFNGAGNLTITGGTFALASDAAFNAANYNGGLFSFTSAADAKLTITGGTFKAPGAKNGDAIYVYGNVNVLEIGGDAVIEGGIQVDGAEAVILSGAPTIQKAANGSAYSLKLADGVKIDATGLTAGADISITKSAEGVFTTNFANAAAAEAAKAYFKADNGTTQFNLAGSALCYGAAPATETAHCEHCDQDVTWTEWDGLTFSAAGHYIVPEGLAQLASHAIVEGIEVVLDLNGQTVTSAGKVFHVVDSGELTIIDSSAAKTGTVIGTGKGTGTNAGVIQVYKKNSSAKLNILGGTYKLAEGTKAKNGAIIHANSTTEVVIKNATIFGAEGALGAAIDFDGAKAVIGQGAVIKAGTASNYGDTIYVTGSGADVTIEGNARIEGGLYVTESAAGKVTVKGTPVIQKVAGGSAYSFMGSTLNVGALETGASIGVTKAEDGVFTTDFADAAAAEAAKGFFTCDVAGKVISVDGKALKVADPATEPDPGEPDPGEPDPNPGEPSGDTCPHCGQVVTWTEWDGTTFTADGHYVVPAGLAKMAEPAAVEKTVVLDLNGQTVESAKKVFNVRNGGNLTIIDTSDAKTGTVIGTGLGSTTNAGVIHVYKDTTAGELTILGGTFKVAAGEGIRTKQGGIIRLGEGAVTIQNATIEGTTSTLGAAIYVAGKSTLTVGEGAVIKAGSARDYGDTIYVTGADPRITIEGNARIEGGIYATGSAAGVITVKGTPVIQKVENGSAYSFMGSSLTVGALEEGAVIGITKADNFEDKAFTTAFATPNAAAAALKYFVSDDATMELRASGTKLVVQPISTATTFDCPHCDDENVVWTAWDGAAITAGGHYYLAEDTVVTATTGVGAAGDENFTVVFNLNGKTISAGEGFAAKIFMPKEGDTMIVMDSSAQGTGTMIGNPGTGNGGLFQVYKGHLVIEGGNYYLSSQTSANKKGGIAYASSGGTITVRDGEFWGGNYENGGVFGQANNKLEITGGVIHAGTSSNSGDSIYVEGTTEVVIGGEAKIEGGVDIRTGSTIAVSGKPVIEKVENGSAYSLKLADGIKVTVGTLETGAKISVTAAAADGIIATLADNAAATAAAGFFAADDTAKVVVADGANLVIAAPATE